MTPEALSLAVTAIWDGVATNWFQLVQTLGIIASALIATVTLRRGQRSRVIENYLKLTQYHREIWKIALEKPELYRVMSSDESLRGQQPTEAEAQFLTFLFLHITCFYEMSKDKQLIEIDTIKLDVGSLLKAPLVESFWNGKKRFYNKDFISFVESSRHGSLLLEENRSPEAALDEARG